MVIRTRCNDGLVTLRITDDGRGISAVDLPRVFDVGFSTWGGHKGMGLALARRIVADHGGKVAISSRPGHTAVTVTLPSSLA